jgi:hypothetical protein
MLERGHKMETMLNQLIVTAVGVGILGAAYLVDLLIGVVKVLFTPQLVWSWKKMLQDFIKAVLMSVGILSFVAVLNVLSWYGGLVGADLSFLGNASYPVLIAAVLGGSGWYMSNAIKNIIAFVNKNSVSVDIDESKVADGTKEVAETVKKAVAEWWVLVHTTDEAAEAHATFEEEGGQGAAYSVSISSYDSFRAAVINKSFDIDGYYDAQCWDGAALLWQQLGRSLSTGGTGAAKGCWTVARTSNAGSDFDLITNFSDLKRGDVIVFGSGTYGHIAFVDQVSPLRILGQNQTGTGNGAPFNVINASSSGFLGAFRYKKWNTTTTTTTTTQKTTTAASTTTTAAKSASTGTVPNNAVANDDIKVGDSVIVNGVGTSDSYGKGAKTGNYTNHRMKVLGTNNGRYALNQYDRGTVGNVADITGWFSKDTVKKA